MARTYMTGSAPEVQSPKRVVNGAHASFLNLPQKKSCWKLLALQILESMIGEEDQSIWVQVPSTVEENQLATRICISLRQLQRRRGCSNLLLQDVLATMRPYLRCLGPRNYTNKDKRMLAEAGVVCLRLHGCTGCNDFVFPVDDLGMLHCPKCAAFRYFDATCKKPKEMVYFFPITPRLKALMKLGKFSRSVDYELWRLSNNNYMTDLQDSPQWQEEMGALPTQGKCLSVLVCLCVLLVFDVRASVC